MLAGLANVYVKRDCIDEAETYYEKALDAHGKQKPATDESELLALYEGLAEVKRFLGKHSTSTKHYLMLRSTMKSSEITMTRRLLRRYERWVGIQICSTFIAFMRRQRSFREEPSEATSSSFRRVSKCSISFYNRPY